MPRHYRPRRTRRPRKTYRRRRRYYRRAAKRGPQAWSRFMLGGSQKATLKYHHSGTLLPHTDAALGNYVFYANSLYDPDWTGLGHQPRGFDQMMLFFDHYVVIGAKIRVTIHNGDDIGPAVTASLCLRDDSPIPDVLTIMETPGVQVRTLGPNGGGKDIATLVQTFSAKKFFKRKVMGDDQLFGTASTNPLEGAFFILHLNYDNTLGAIAKPCEISIDIDYTAIFTEPKMPAAS